MAYPVLGYMDFFVPTGFHEVNAPGMQLQLLCQP
jgi:hypothetical protein